MLASKWSDAIHAADLRQRGITGLWVFVSAARSEAQPDSYVDLVASLNLAERVTDRPRQAYGPAYRNVSMRSGRLNE